MVEQNIVIKITADDENLVNDFFQDVVSKLNQGATSGTETGRYGSYSFTVTNN